MDKTSLRTSGLELSGWLVRGALECNMALILAVKGKNVCSKCRHKVCDFVCVRARVLVSLVSLKHQLSAGRFFSESKSKNDTKHM